MQALLKQSASTVQASPPCALQSPAMQLAPVWQVTPQVPQADGSVCRSTQLDPQAVAPLGQPHCRRPVRSLGPQKPVQQLP